jgi:isobutyryl-CoA mutase
LHILTFSVSQLVFKDMAKPKSGVTANPFRIVTASSLFDGHDAAINIMRRIIQSSGAEVIHLGHDRSVDEIVNCAIQEDANAIAITSYQGGHMEFFKYMFDLLKEKGYGHIKIFGGGGGTILPDEITELEKYGIERIYSPDDGRKMGLQGMISDLLGRIPHNKTDDIELSLDGLKKKDYGQLSKIISLTENEPQILKDFLNELTRNCADQVTPVLGITGTGGSGKSSLIDEFVRRFTADYPDKKLAIIAIDPTKRKSGGALLGDRIRMNSIHHPGVFMRSMATRQAHMALSKHISEVLCIIKHAGFDLILLETSGIGQSDTEITNHSDLSVYVMTPEYGASSQLEKIDMLDFADMVIINKTDRKGSADAIRDVRKQYMRNHLLWDKKPEELPVYGTHASQFNDPGLNIFYVAVMNALNEKAKLQFKKPGSNLPVLPSGQIHIIPGNRIRYLSEIAETVDNYNKWAEDQSVYAQELYALNITKEKLSKHPDGAKNTFHSLSSIEKEIDCIRKKISEENLQKIENWEKKVSKYSGKTFTYPVRKKEIQVETKSETLSHLKIPKVTLPAYKAWGDRLKWELKENVPGEFPFVAGVYPFRRENEDPTRMFAGEGIPERTNWRFHYLSEGMPVSRLSTAFDSVTLYGHDPETRPDIYGKVGNSGVSVATLNDAKKLYSGFNLVDPATSVSMTINGPAPIMTAFFMNAAIDQQCEIYIRDNGLEKDIETKIDQFFRKKGTKRPIYNGKLPKGNNELGLMFLGVPADLFIPAEVYEKIKAQTIATVRGTVQADILKEDQAQNTCIFSTDFSLKLMGDIQQYFIENQVRNFYSVSISGYHIAEAGANPVTQLAFTLANAFTYVEYYLSRGMKIDDFAPNLSFFFSNGVDAEYAVLGRVARSIWAKAMKYLYKANERSQMLKYHIQTSGRSLHAQEIDFNDIRTTLQAVYAIFDNCNSLHTNAYDEALTTPTEESVRRAMAIQLIINQELGLNKNQNPMQGSFIIEELTNLVEEAVIKEFERISERGGVLGAMETMYQRGKIQEESMYYENLKHTGDLPVVGVNTFLSSKGSPTTIPGEIIRSTEEEKKFQIAALQEFHKTYAEKSDTMLAELKAVVLKNENVFEKLMEVTKYCSLGQITRTLFDVGGKYRRNM